MNRIFYVVLVTIALQSCGRKVLLNKPDFSAPQELTGMKLVWNDEFNTGGAPDAKISFTSSSINTRGNKEWLYGTFIIRAKIDTTLGSWPAIWTLGVKEPWPANGEIDIMEFYRTKTGSPIVLANFAWGKEYWLVQIQTDLYNLVRQYLEQNNMTQTEFADKFGVTKGYISQIMNGNFNHSLAKLIEISLAIGKVPSMNFNNIEDISKSESTTNIDAFPNHSDLLTYKQTSLVA